MKPSVESKLSFEDALAQLEDLIARIETGDIPLAELVDQFQRGNKLLTICTARLQDAEQKIQLLQQERKGVSFQEFDPDKE
ncbi:MAG: exodeoxyribonuclease VII small subunit [Opitutaceae bacterium]